MFYYNVILLRNIMDASRIPKEEFLSYERIGPFNPMNVVNHVFITSYLR